MERAPALADHNVDGIIFHGRIKHFLHLAVEPVDLIYEEHIVFLQAVQDRSHLSRLLDRGA